MTGRKPDSSNTGPGGTWAYQHAWALLDTATWNWGAEEKQPQGEASSGVTQPTGPSLDSQASLSSLPEASQEQRKLTAAAP